MMMGEGARGTEDLGGDEEMSPCEAHNTVEGFRLATLQDAFSCCVGFLLLLSLSPLADIDKLLVLHISASPLARSLVESSLA